MYFFDVLLIVLIHFQNATAFSDRVCSACTLGVTFKDTVGQSLCLPIANCVPGTFQSTAATQSSNRLCSACNGVTNYQDQTNQLTCKNVSTVCPAGNQMTQAATAQSDITCGPCGLGYFNPGGSLLCTQATSCAVGAQEVS